MTTLAIYTLNNKHSTVPFDAKYTALIALFYQRVHLHSTLGQRSCFVSLSFSISDVWVLFKPTTQLHLLVLARSGWVGVYERDVSVSFGYLTCGREKEDRLLRM